MNTAERLTNCQNVLDATPLLKEIMQEEFAPLVIYLETSPEADLTVFNDGSYLISTRETFIPSRCTCDNCSIQFLAWVEETYPDLFTKLCENTQ